MVFGLLILVILYVYFQGDNSMNVVFLLIYEPYFFFHLSIIRTRPKLTEVGNQVCFAFFCLYNFLLIYHINNGLHIILLVNK